MRIAFYAPLKPPDHPVPSGDRRVAQLLLAALVQAGYEPILASRFRSYDGSGDAARQARLKALGTGLAARCLRRWARSPGTAPGLWLTYHLYYKAPDWLGPPVAAALGIPYVVVEASHAAKRAAGGWRLGHDAVAAAVAGADTVIGLNPADHDGIAPLLRQPERWIALKPFLDAAAYRRGAPHSGPPRLITVAMMRHGDKLASYRLLGAALHTMLDRPWSLDVVGDGPARAAVEAALAPLGARVTWCGALPPMALAQLLTASDLFLWPAINEAFGMALLEAQAAGLPVVAGSGGGVADVVAAGSTGLLVPPGDIAAFAAATGRLLADAAMRRGFGDAAWARVRREHDLPAAARRLAMVINRTARMHRG